MTLIAGFCIVGAAIIGVFGGRWLVWGGLAFVALVLAWRGTK